MMVDVDPIWFCRLAGLRGRAPRKTDGGHGGRARHEVAPVQRSTRERERALIATCTSAIRPAMPVVHNILPSSPFRTILIWPGRLRPQPSMMATARVQPADARSILTGKHDTVKPVDGNCSRLCSFSMWQ